MKNILIHVPHSSLYIPEEYRKTALISQKELEEENRFICDRGIIELIPPAFKDRALIFPYSRLYCDVERFRDDSEPMNRLGMGYIYTHDTKGREIFRPSAEHRAAVDRIYAAHHSELDDRVSGILKEYGSCVIIDLHSYSDEMVQRLFGYENCPDVCIGTEQDHYSGEIVQGLISICRGLGLSTALNYPYSGSIIPNRYYGRKRTGIVSIMLEINKRILQGVF